jgi:hypothetical protein
MCQQTKAKKEKKEAKLRLNVPMADIQLKDNSLQLFEKRPAKRCQSQGYKRREAPWPHFGSLVLVFNLRL